MRILLMLSACIILLMLAVLVTGALLPKRHVVKRNASYRVSPDVLFQLLAGPQNWRPDVLRSENVPDASGRELMRETDQSGNTITYELLDSVPSKTLTRRISTPNLPYSGSWTFLLENNNGVTTVWITEDGEVYNPLFRFVSKFILGQTRTIDEYLRALGKATGQAVEIKD